MRFIEKTDGKLSFSNGSVNALNTNKKKHILLTLYTKRNPFPAKYHAIKS